MQFLIIYCILAAMLLAYLIYGTYRITFEDFIIMSILCLIWPISLITALILHAHERFSENFKQEHNAFLNNFYELGEKDRLKTISKLDEATAENFLYGINMRYIDVNKRELTKYALKKRLNYFKAERDFEKYFLNKESLWQKLKLKK